MSLYTFYLEHLWQDIAVACFILWLICEVFKVSNYFLFNTMSIKTKVNAWHQDVELNFFLSLN